MLKLSLALLVSLAPLLSVAQTGTHPGTQTGHQTSEPRVATRSGTTIACRYTDGCVEEEIDGRRSYILRTPQLTVRVAENPDKKYTRFSVTVENRTSKPVHLDPADFRVEVNEPKFKRLGYLEPAALKLPKPKRVKAVRASASAAHPGSASAFVAASAPLSECTESSPTSLNPAAAEPLSPVFLAAATLSPAETTSGQVFFERSGNATSISLMLPISGAVFEFAYTPTRP